VQHSSCQRQLIGWATLRIASKKLRYGAAFFGSPFCGKKHKVQRKRFGRLLKMLQGALGALNDVEVHKSFARRIARPRRRAGR
jgi:CHAD domain-containing protein